MIQKALEKDINTFIVLHLFTQTCVAYMGKVVRTVAMSPGDAHSSRRQFLEECAPPGEIHRDMFGVYGKYCMDSSNVSTWCEFFKAAIP